MCLSTLLKKGSTFAYANFDDERLKNLKGEDLNEVLEILYKLYGKFSYLFLDEIQNVEDWHLFVNRLLRKNIHVVITGSNSKLLSSELATHLTGRNVQIELFPFSFSEFCDYLKVDIKKINTEARALRRATFDKYLKQGGFPELLAGEDAKLYISALVDGILHHDIQDRFDIKYVGAFRQLSNHLLNTVPVKTNLKDLQQLFNISSAHTVKNYISYLKQTFLLVGLHKYSTKSKLRIRDEKLYAVDIALIDKRSDCLVGENLGWRLETIVYLELLRRYKPRQMDIFYFNETAGECDFLVCEGNKVVELFQVSYDISNPKTKRRELSGLNLASKRTGCNKMTLITYDTRGEESVASGTVQVVAAFEWLLHLV